MPVTREAAQLFYEFHDLYARYGDALDDGPLELWPTFFTDQCMYQIIPRDNFDRNLPIAIMRCESRAMIEDRVTAVNETMMYEPRYLRHHTTDFRISEATETSAIVKANFSVVEVLPDELPRILMTGRYLDRLERNVTGEWLFNEKICVFDSVLVPNSIVYPV
ncbi:MAG: 3-phenylpropionate/cinnamic acid dioxygenase small subunit [Gammaproteobacteria bacterium]|jgi:3-phenylpropionate/cinnamic acid dioxygenase small subunit